MAGERILFADDEEHIRKLVTAFLERRGYSVVTARDGLEALRLARAEPLDLVITDVNMPELDGLALARQLREDHRTSRVPILMLSARKEAGDVLSGYEVGADDYVPKPVEMSVLAAKIETALRRSSPAARAAAARGGRVVVFVHAKGGVGTTTLAASVAASLAAASQRAAVLDLNLEFPSAAMLLDVRVTRTLAEIDDESVAELDDAAFSALVAVDRRSGVEILTASQRPGTAARVRLRSVQQALDRLRSRADHVIVDTHASLSQATLAALDAADLSIVVTTADPASLRATRECVTALAELGVPRDRTLVALNRASEGALAAAAQTLGREPDVVIADAPLVDATSASAEGVRALVARIGAIAPLR